LSRLFTTDGRVSTCFVSKTASCPCIQRREKRCRNAPLPTTRAARAAKLTNKGSGRRCTTERKKKRRCATCLWDVKIKRERERVCVCVCDVQLYAKPSSRTVPPLISVLASSSCFLTAYLPYFNLLAQVYKFTLYSIYCRQVLRG